MIITSPSASISSGSLINTDNNIARLNPSEWEAVRRDVLEVERLAFGKGAFSEKLLREQFTDPDNIVIVARNPAGKVIGYISTYFEDRNTFCIDNLAIHSNAQGQGISTMLLKKMKEVIDTSSSIKYVAFDATTQQDERDLAKQTGKPIVNRLSESMKRAFGGNVLEEYDHDSKYGMQRYVRLKLTKP